MSHSLLDGRTHIGSTVKFRYSVESTVDISQIYDRSTIDVQYITFTSAFFFHLAARIHERQSFRSKNDMRAYSAVVCNTNMKDSISERILEIGISSELNEDIVNVFVGKTCGEGQWIFPVVGVPYKFHSVYVHQLQFVAYTEILS